jgi:hypothetical protein
LRRALRGVRWAPDAASRHCRRRHDGSAAGHGGVSCSAAHAHPSPPHPAARPSTASPRHATAALRPGPAGAESMTAIPGRCGCGEGGLTVCGVGGAGQERRRDPAILMPVQATLRVPRDAPRRRPPPPAISVGSWGAAAGELRQPAEWPGPVVAWPSGVLARGLAGCTHWQACDGPTPAVSRAGARPSTFCPSRGYSPGCPPPRPTSPGATGPYPPHRLVSPPVPPRFARRWSRCNP